ncbi:MAG TPA: cytochrome C [Anaeromyxobacter sp.]|nr:cytochrome C [Anaeromyxobacter sp.]
MEHARHVFRVIFVLLLALVAFVLGRTWLVPKSYGLYGPYRFDNVAEQAAIRAPLHAGAASCAGCHEEKAKKLAAGVHQHVSCEVCHGPAGRHAKEGKVVAKAAIDRSFTNCARCHRKILGRPEKFPQVVLEQHVQQMGPSALEGKVCLECHDPHSPKL